MHGRLPLVGAHEREHVYCSYCPKLCRSSCPVSTVHGSETTTPWGKMSSLHHVAAGNVPMHQEHAATWYACTGCMRCRSFCAHGNDVASALRAGRAEAVAIGAAPEAVRTFIDQHSAREGRAIDAAKRIFGARASVRERHCTTVFFPGCSALLIAEAEARAGLAVVERLASGRVRVEASGCCGLPLLEAGDITGFRAAVRRTVGALDGTADVVFLDPGCLHALKVLAPALGEAGACKLPARHITELLAQHASKLGRLACEGPFRWHDPCRLGRGLGVYEEPRVALHSLLGRKPDEFPSSMDRAECAGGGFFEITDPRASRAVARELGARHLEAGGGTIVTGCPSAGRMLREHGGGVAVEAMVTLAARALG